MPISNQAKLFQVSLVLVSTSGFISGKELMDKGLTDGRYERLRNSEPHRKEAPISTKVKRQAVRPAPPCLLSQKQNWEILLGIHVPWNPAYHHRDPDHDG